MCYHSKMLSRINILIFVLLSAINSLLMNGKFSRNLTDYQLAVPHRATPDGEFHTFHLDYHHEYDAKEFDNRKKRELDDPHSLHYAVLIDNELHHLEMWPNRHLIHPRAAIERYNGSKYRGTNEIRTPQSLKMCYYHGRVRGVKDSSVALSTCNGLAGEINMNNKKYYIEPVLGHQKNSDGHHLHVIHTQDGEKFCGTTERVKRDMDYLVNDALEKLYVKNGFKVLKRDAIVEDVASKVKDTAHRMWFELLIVLDQYIMDFLQGHVDQEEFALNVINSANQIYHDPTMPILIDLVVVRMIFLDKNEDTIKWTNSNYPAKELVKLCEWTNSFNPPGEDHPNHFDVTAYYTALDVCHGAGNCGTAGMALMGAGCTLPINCLVVESHSGLRTGLLLAHEVGHLLGMDHDVYDPPTYPCNDKDGKETFIMSEFAGAGHRFSPCSIVSFLTLNKEHYFDCFYDEPIGSDYEDAVNFDLLPGAVYGIDLQCFFFVGSANKTSKVGTACYPKKKGVLCDKMYCRMPFGCAGTSNRIPYDGTPCGPTPSTHYCFRRACILKGSEPASEDGGWSEWGPWAECSATCGKGLQERERTCNSPRPKNRGKYCPGVRKSYQLCIVMDCPPEEQSRRVLSCIATYDRYGSARIRKDIGNKKNIVTGMIDKDQPCINVCGVKLKNQASISPYVFGLYVPDGIKCKLDDPNYVCIDGNCGFAACKGAIEPDNIVVEDMCGVCDGDGTLCKTVEDSYSGSSQNQWHKLADVPAGARSLKFWNSDPLNGVLAIGDPNNGETAINNPNEIDQSLITGAYPFYDKYMFYYEQELIEGGKKGALITIKVTHVRVDTALYISHTFPVANLNRGDNVKVFWQYYEREETPQRQPKFKWDFDEYSECSHKCGGGIAEPIIQCFEEVAGKVSRRFCEEPKLAKPKMEPKICNQDPCTPEWRVGPWGPCRACRKRGGVRTREVQCVKEAGRKKGDPVLLDDSDCPGIKPGFVELCITRKVCGNRKRRRPAMPGQFQDSVWRQMKKIHIIKKRLVTPFKATKTVATLFPETTTPKTTVFTWTPPKLKDKMIFDEAAEPTLTVEEVVVIESNNSAEDVDGEVEPITMLVLNGTTRTYVENSKKRRDQIIKHFMEKEANKTTKKPPK